MKNIEIAQALTEMSGYLEVLDVPFKPRAYARAAGAIEAFNEEIVDVYKRGGLRELEKISGVGRGIGEKIEELLHTGKIKELEQMKKKLPIQLNELSAVEGVGPKAIKVFYKILGVKTVADLEQAAQMHKISKLPHFGKKSEDKILNGIEFLKKNTGRMLLGEALPLAQSIEDHLSQVPGVRRVTVCGSLRRGQETIGDIDIVAVSSNPKKVMRAFTTMPDVNTIYGAGSTKGLVRLSSGIDADLRVVPDAVYGAAVQYFTGDKQHNIELRKIAIKKGYKLSEYGLFKGKKMIAAKTEDEIYKKLDMEYIPPELRTASGEIAAAQNGTLPTLIPYGSIRGDLQVQTCWTDGSSSIEDMAQAALAVGLEYIAITDHTKTLAMTHGLDEQGLSRQSKEIDALNTRFKIKNFTIFKSAEVNILKDGSFDISDAALKKLDIVSAAVHTLFHLSEKEQAERIIRAMKHPSLNILFHPTGRLIGKREAYAVDIEKIIRAAREYGVILEVNASPERLDLKDAHIRSAIEKGVKLVVDSDAHAPGHFHFLDYGVAQVRRGWGEKSAVLNTLSAQKCLAAIKKLKIKRTLRNT